MSLRAIELAQEVFNGSLEAKKQNATYVGLNKVKGKVDIAGKIKHPYQIKRKAVTDQITKVNDYLLVTGIGIRFGQYSLDNDEVESVLKHKTFLRRNFINWRPMSYKAKKRIKSIQIFFKERILPLR